MNHLGELVIDFNILQQTACKEWISIPCIYSLYLCRLVISVRHTHSSSEKTNKYPLDQIQSLQLVDCRMQTHVRNSKLNIYNFKYEYHFNLEPLDFKASPLSQLASIARAT